MPRCVVKGRCSRVTIKEFSLVRTRPKHRYPMFARSAMGVRVPYGTLGELGGLTCSFIRRNYIPKLGGNILVPFRMDRMIYMHLFALSNLFCTSLLYLQFS